MRIELTTHEYLTAALIGFSRSYAAAFRGQRDKFPVGGDRYRNDIEGAAAELAGGRGLSVYWPGFVDPGREEFDLPGWGEVRWSARRDACLIVRQADDPERRYLLVTGQFGVYELRGWLYGREARRAEWERHRGAWFVPQSALRSVEQLELWEESA